MIIAISDEQAARILNSDIGKTLGLEEAVANFIDQALCPIEVQKEVDGLIAKAMQKLRDTPVGKTIAPLALIPRDSINNRKLIGDLFKALRHPDQVLAVESKDTKSGYPVFTRI